MKPVASAKIDSQLLHMKPVASAKIDSQLHMKPVASAKIDYQLHTKPVASAKIDSQLHTKPVASAKIDSQLHCLWQCHVKGDRVIGDISKPGEVGDLQNSGGAQRVPDRAGLKKNRNV